MSVLKGFARFTAVVLAHCLASIPALADGDWTDMLSYSGFGTLGLARSDTAQAVWVQNIQSYGAKSNWDYRTDADIVVIGNPSAPDLARDEIIQLFLGKRQTMKPLDRSNSDPIKAQFYRKLSGQDLSQVKATWSRLVFTGKAFPPKELPDAAAVRKAVHADARAIGYVNKSEADSTVKILLVLN